MKKLILLSVLSVSLIGLAPLSAHAFSCSSFAYQAARNHGQSISEAIQFAYQQCW